MKKISRNDICPCGSGKKYKKCCINNEYDIDFLNPNNFFKNYKYIRKNSRIKQCLHPNNEECSEKIIGAHSIQNNKILKRISTNGQVYMPCPKNDNPFLPMSKWGRKEATVFTGFCGYHDNEIFKPIENENFDKSNYHIFLYIYRCFALEYHKKMESVNMKNILINKIPSKTNDIQNIFSGSELSINDLDECKKEFDNALITKNYDILSNLVWEFDHPIKFAASGFTILDKDLKGNTLQDLRDKTKKLNHVFVTIFPEGEKTYCIIAWLKSNDDLFKGYKEQISNLNITQQKVYINNLLPIITENITINPEAWDNLEQFKKDEFGMLSYGIADLFSFESGENYNMLEPTSYDLFNL
ncbi:hypothetical protein I9Y31_003295 [Clostridium perfringens]|nr:hypothetical protein [Clostridium perfringens]